LRLLLLLVVFVVLLLVVVVLAVVLVLLMRNVHAPPGLNACMFTKPTLPLSMVCLGRGLAI
jgi:hypothetical protein